jgi:S1-C subfamily serine protease
VPIAVLREGRRLVVQARIARLDDETPAGPQLAGDDGKGALGIAVQTVTPRVAHELGLDRSDGVVIREVRDDGRAANAGLRAGDVIVSIDRHPTPYETSTR